MSRHVTYAASKLPHSVICSNKRPTSLAMSLSFHASDTRKNSVDSPDCHGCAAGRKGRKGSELAKQIPFDRQMIVSLRDLTSRHCASRFAHFLASKRTTLLAGYLGRHRLDALAHPLYASKSFLSQCLLIRRVALAIKTALCTTSPWI